MAINQYSVLSTQYSALSTQNSELRTQYSELSTQNSVLSTQYSELSTQISILIRLFLFKKLADDASVILIVDAGEKFGAELSYSLRAVKRHTFIHHSSAEVTGHAFGLKYRFDLRVEVDANFGIAHQRQM